MGRRGRTTKQARDCRVEWREKAALEYGKVPYFRVRHERIGMYGHVTPELVGELVATSAHDDDVLSHNLIQDLPRLPEYREVKSRVGTRIPMHEKFLVRIIVGEQVHQEHE